MGGYSRERGSQARRSCPIPYLSTVVLEAFVIVCASSEYGSKKLASR